MQFNHKYILHYLFKFNMFLGLCNKFFEFHQMFCVHDMTLIYPFLIHLILIKAGNFNLDRRYLITTVHNNTYLGTIQVLRH